jgi:ribonuclease HI
MRKKKAVIWIDGASRNNPGPAAIGAVIKNEQGRVHARLSRRIGTATNNQAEYRAVIAALEKTISLGAHQVALYSDSDLVVKQINGQYRVRKPELKLLHQRVKQLQDMFENFTVNYIPRWQNAEADNLANKALDLAVD